MNEIMRKVTNLIFKLFYWPLCRAYSRFIIGDKPADAVYRFLCSIQFFRTHRFWPDFVNPKRFSEKIWYRMFHDRDSIYTLINDKMLVRDFVKSKIGTEYLIPLLWQGDNPAAIPFEKLPLKFVIKANHGCGYNIIVNDKSKIEPDKVKKQLSRWLNTNYCQNFLLGIEWGYKNIKPHILIEEHIGESGKIPVDYKFYCFSGRVEFVTVHFDRFIEHKTRSFDREFKPYDFTYHFHQWNGDCLRPQNFETMVNLADKLADGFDFMRVDLYTVDNRIYFSELTPYPGGVSTKFLPTSRDLFLGNKWIINI